MTVEQFQSTFFEWHPLHKQPRLREGAINGPHERANGPSVHKPASVGRTVVLMRRFGYPEYKEWVEQYFRSGEGLRKLVSKGVPADASLHGRTAADLVDKSRLLLEFLHGEPDLNPDDYTLELVCEWFGHVVLVRSWIGAQGERKIFDKLVTAEAGWRPATDHEDLKLRLDFIHERSRRAIQVKRSGWSKDTRRVDDWIRHSASFDGTRFLVEYTFNGSRAAIGNVFKVRGNQLVLSKRKATQLSSTIK